MADVQLELIAHLKNLPPLQVPLQQVLTLLNNNQSDWATISRAMLKDPVLTGRVLQIANSSFYGLGRQVKDIEVACTVLGSETLRGLIYTLILLSEFRHGKKNSLLDYNLLWKHCLNVACLAKVIARKTDQHPTTAFTAGLFHCLDLIIQDYFFPDELAERFEKYCTVNQLEKSVKVFSMIDTDYWFLTAVLLDYWQFPPAIVSVFDPDSSAGGLIKSVILASYHTLKNVGPDGEVVIAAPEHVTEQLRQSGLDLSPINLRESVDEGKKLYLEMVGWIVN